MPILSNPADDACPDFLSQACLDLRTAHKNGRDMTDEVAAAELTTLWRALQAMKQVEWDRLQAEQQEAEQQALERQEAERVEQERLEAEGREREPAQLPPDGQPVDPESAEEFADFDAGAPCDDQAVQRASSYATDRLNRGVYVELFYWTLLGFSEAEMDSRTVADDTLSFARTGTGTKNEVAFRPTSSLRASKNAIPDHLLSWSDFDTAKSNMLAYFKQPTCRWPKSHAEALEVFWYGLCMHPYRNKGVHGERALLIVQSQVRREWHDKLAAKKLDKSVKVFDISVLNEERIRRTYSDVLLRRVRALSSVNLATLLK